MTKVCTIHQNIILQSMVYIIDTVIAEVHSIIGLLCTQVIIYYSRELKHRHF